MKKRPNPEAKQDNYCRSAGKNDPCGFVGQGAKVAVIHDSLLFQASLA